MKKNTLVLITTIALVAALSEQAVPGFLLEWGSPLVIAVMAWWGFYHLRQIRAASKNAPAWAIRNWKDDDAPPVPDEGARGGCGYSLDYLDARYSNLGSAIRRMTGHSAWARWYAAQILTVGQPIGEGELLKVACLVVLRAIRDGALQVRGRKPGIVEYEAIPSTDWLSSGQHMHPDRISLWRLLFIPVGGSQNAPGGALEALGVADARTNRLREYDSFVVDAFQFEKLWPKTDKEMDKETRAFLSAARKAGADRTEVKRLSLSSKAPFWRD